MSAAEESPEHATEVPEREARRLRWLLALAAALFFVGISTPMITISKFIVVENSFSILSGVIELLRLPAR